MADKTPIEWSDATWNPITGCSVISPGCTNCYAMRLAGTRMKTHPSRAGLTIDTKAGPVWNGQVRFNEQWLAQPLQWKRPRMIFVCAHADLFHEAVPDEWIDQVFAVMALAPHHQFQVLTKRSKRMREYMLGLNCDGARRFVVAKAGCREANQRGFDGDLVESRIIDKGWPLPNVWLGVSAEDQRRADERIPDLLATPAAIRWLSAEPVLGALDLTKLDLIPWLNKGKPAHEHDPHVSLNALTGMHNIHPIHGVEQFFQRGLDWVVAGGESGPGARPMHPDWARSLRDQCAAAGVPFLFKQWGNWLPVSGMDEDQIDACYHPAPEDDPDCIRREKIASVVMHRDGTVLTGSARYAFGAYAQGTGSMMMWPVGKKAAGRLLDGIEHNGFPVVGGRDG